MQLGFDFQEAHEGALCPFCGEMGDDFDGLDMLGNQVDWMPCCEGLRDAVQHYGWEEVFGYSLENAVETMAGEAPRELYDGGPDEDGDLRDDDYVARFALRIIDPTTVLPDGTCKSPAGWQSRLFGEVDEHHRHHDAPQGWKFGVEAWNGREKVGVAIVGHPQARALHAAEPKTLEVLRVATWGDSRLRRNAASKLYAACAARGRELGATKLVTYTLEEENGASLRASGFTEAAKTAGGTWSRNGRPREDKAPTGPKTRWERRIA